ncbi:pilus assembly protein TadG-related protein [Limnoglobus roseus]|uniref:Putative Flp pilus-assembly TadG-like N-terminal domain-containing protein n=1 Tax=Limnoglobus roseus TaxID=2598579 RepID=A0A5C1AIX0_9BACT|nr:pilus assembly protein TadG-related protein [Limnoglobus roseus]QEL17642.1 hypothetical protein PX52LOC_04640 [Limnoglobus roseus]
MLVKNSSGPNRPGAVLAKVAICLPVLIGVVALNLDGGRTMDERRRAQAAADAAALAAGADLYAHFSANKGLDPAGTARAAAEQVAAANGYPAPTVTVTIPPASGPYAGQAGHAEVSIATTLDATFGRVFTAEAAAVSARAVGRGEPLKFGIIALNRTKAGAFTSTAAAFALVARPLVVNSNHPRALVNSSLVWLSLAPIKVTGGIDNSGLLAVTTKARTGVPPTYDPLAFLPVPDTAGMPVRSATPLTLNGLIYTLQPGVYKGGIRITGLSVVVMQPGVYVMEGGGFRVDGLATVAGLGTMVYNTTSPTYPAGPISVSGVGKVVMTAPLSGTYQGLNFFQHRGLAQPISLTGLGLTTITGVIYAASAAVTLTGSVAIGLDILGGAYVVDTLTVGGIGGVTIDLGTQNAPKVPDVRLVE